jgi:hypothetical protein
VPNHVDRTPREADERFRDGNPSLCRGFLEIHRGIERFTIVTALNGLIALAFVKCHDIAPLVPSPAKLVVWRGASKSVNSAEEERPPQ